MTNKQKGIICIILAAFSFAFVNVFVRMSGDLPFIQKSFFRNLVACFSAFIILKKHNETFKIKKGNLKYLILRSSFGTIGILCNFYAVDHLVLSDATMLNKMSPFFVIIFSYFILKEKLTFIQGSAVAIAFLGSLLIIKPTLSNLSIIPSLIGLLGGIGAGMAYTMIRILGKHNQKGPFVVFFFSGFSCIVTLPFLIYQFTPMTSLQLLILLLAGISATVGQIAITQAYMFAAGKEISVYDYSQIIFAAILGFIIFGQIPDIYSIFGYIIICGMAILMFFYNNSHTKNHKLKG